MKVLLVNGSPNESKSTYTALREVADSLEKNGVNTEILWIGSDPMQGCSGCGSCWTTGKCRFDDKVNDVLARLEDFDGFVFGTPVYYASAAGQLCSFLDRMFYASSGRFANKVGAAIAVCRRSGTTDAVDRLNKYFTISKMPIVSSNYWNGVHGNSAEEIKQDAEGMQTMRLLGANMAWLIKSIEAGRAAGLGDPVLEDRVWTNFIR
jgi:multimeric flavodoxin WrbA